MSYGNFTLLNTTTRTQPFNILPVTTHIIAPDTYYPNAIIESCYLIFHLLIFIPSLLGNSLAFISLLAARSNLYPWFLNLVTADLLKTVFCMPYSLYILSNNRFRIGGELYPPLCEFEGFVFLVCLLVSLVSHAGISIDRVIATISPFYYAKKLIVKNPLTIILPTWITIICLCIVPMIDTKGYGYSTYVPMCYIELHNMLTGWTLPDTVIIWGVSVIHFIFIGIPIITVCISSSIVTVKLCNVSEIRNVFKCEKTDSKLYLEEKVSTLESNRSNRSTKFSKVSFDETTQISNILRNDSNKMEIEETERRSSHCHEEKDKMILLHTNPSQKRERHVDKMKRRHEIQRKAIVTMILVAVTFLCCHIMILIFWAFWDLLIADKFNSCVIPTRKQSDKDFSYGMCVSFPTLQITMVYLNSPLNVLIYYLRCTYLKEGMLKSLSSLKRAFFKPFRQNAC